MSLSSAELLSLLSRAASAAQAYAQTLPVWVWAAPLAALGVAAAGVAALIIVELSKPTPRGGSATTLPNGMRITHWQQSETQFLYDEIWGAESAYAGGRGGAAALRFAPGAVIVDAGANIGMFSLYAAARCGGDVRIFAFEPIPSTFGVLAANAAAANRGEFGAVFRPFKGAKVAIKAFNCGLSDKAADVVFEHHPNFSVWSTTDAKFAQQRIDRIAGDLPRATACVRGGAQRRRARGAAPPPRRAARRPRSPPPPPAGTATRCSCGCCPRRLCRGWAASSSRASGTWSRSTRGW
jgi:FkbM family methyltransferase